jgi:hypothetical protein
MKLILPVGINDHRFPETDKLSAELFTPSLISAVDLVFASRFGSESSIASGLRGILHFMGLGLSSLLSVIVFLLKIGQFIDSLNVALIIEAICFTAELYCY